jgi:hypothetical protein
MDGGDGQPPAGLVGIEAVGRRRDGVEGVAHRRQIAFTGRGQAECAVEAPEQDHTEARLQGLDLVADRRLGDVQLVRRSGEAEVAGSRLEGAQRIQGW